MNIFDARLEQKYALWCVGGMTIPFVNTIYFMFYLHEVIDMRKMLDYKLWEKK